MTPDARNCTGEDDDEDKEGIVTRTQNHVVGDTHLCIILPPPFAVFRHTQGYFAIFFFL